MDLTVGTRKSTLALWQSNLVSRMLSECGMNNDLKAIQSEGDQILDRPLHQVGFAGIFTRTLDHALIHGEIDIAVHSAKDIPSVIPEELEIIAFLKREDPRDVLLSNDEEFSLENVARSLVVGTSSLRRKAFLKHYFPQVEVRDIRGNVDSRVKRVVSGEFDAIMLAYAAVKRMGFNTDFFIQKLNPQTFVPAVGQGSIAVMSRKDLAEKEKIKHILNHPNTEIAIETERSFLREIQGGCQLPVFGLATVGMETISLTAGMAAENGATINAYNGNVPATLNEGKILGIKAARAVKANEAA